MLGGYQVFAVLGFLLAAYAIVANDAIQTLGTFLSSNQQRPWWVLWIYACTLIAAVMLYGWFGLHGDIAFGRLNNIPYPDGGVRWWHVVPPAALLLLTRLGIPVSTTFLVLTIFTLTGGAATDGVLAQMLAKSSLGYVLALVTGGVVYALVARGWVMWVHRTRDEAPAPYWIALQWLSTAFLWTQWLMQDLANIFVFLPRHTVHEGGHVAVSFDPLILVLATVIMMGLHAWIFARRGGRIQKIVLRKTNTTDIRAATLVDFVYGIILFLFIEVNDIPMSTTWVFLGLLAGREIAISYMTGLRSRREALLDVSADVGRAWVGLAVSTFLAICIPWAATGRMPHF